MTHHHLDLTALNYTVAHINHYPVSNTEIAALARHLDADQSVQDFFEHMPNVTTFDDETELISRTEEAALLDDEYQDQPYEQLRSYD